MNNSIFLFYNQTEDSTLTSSPSVLPVSNLKNSQRTKIWRSSGNTAYIDITLNEVLGADYLALVDLNMTTAGMIRVRAWMDRIDGSNLVFDRYYDPLVFVSSSEEDVDYGMGDYGLGGYGSSTPASAGSRKNVNLLPFDETLIAPYYRVDLVDESLPYIQMGVLFLSKSRRYEVNLSYNWNIKQIDRSVSKESISGQKYVQPRDTRLQINGTFGALNEMERTDTIVAITEVGNTKPFIYSVFPLNNNVGLTTTIYGSFSDSNLTQKFNNRNEFNFTVVEDL